MNKIIEFIFYILFAFMAIALGLGAADYYFQYESEKPAEKVAIEAMRDVAMDANATTRTALRWTVTLILGGMFSLCAVAIVFLMGQRQQQTEDNTRRIIANFLEINERKLLE